MELEEGSVRGWVGTTLGIGEYRRWGAPTWYWEVPVLGAATLGLESTDVGRNGLRLGLEAACRGRNSGRLNLGEEIANVGGIGSRPLFFSGEFG